MYDDRLRDDEVDGIFDMQAGKDKCLAKFLFWKTRRVKLLD